MVLTANGQEPVAGSENRGRDTQKREEIKRSANVICGIRAEMVFKCLGKITLL